MGTPAYTASPYPRFLQPSQQPAGSGVSQVKTQIREAKGFSESHNQEIVEVFYCLGWADSTQLPAGKQLHPGHFLGMWGMGWVGGWGVCVRGGGGWRQGSGRCSFCSLGGQGGFCLIPCLPWAQKKNVRGGANYSPQTFPVLPILPLGEHSAILF